jgi:cellulose synthase/poly-beta-1,6-N-acetylglucosamine synthase-like glycosyltransferase
MFTLDYTVWFDYYLPALDYLNVPIPLGGTSNHFKIQILELIKGWDPHNVTEDADLGVRLSAMGYRVATIESTTFEEATIHIGSWINQRSRWIKGYMQTWLVNMRHPISFYKKVGPRGFWGFQFFIGGNTFLILINPVLWFFFIGWLLTDSPVYALLFKGDLINIALINLIIGNGIGIYTGIVATQFRKLNNLGIYSFFMPFYWVLQSIAGVKATIGLITNPFYWHKTSHGKTKLGHLDSHG